ncbi:Na+/H+ antiporter subunit E [Candidatus Margulisiibacteriota bacterium]
MKAAQPGAINRIIITFSFLFVVWLLFTFSLRPFSLLLGVVFSFIIALFTYDLFIEKEEKIQQGRLPRFQYFPLYVFVLLWEIYWSSFIVVYQVITMRINPGIVKIRTRLKSRFACALLANSITLTPGTVTVDLEGDQLTVHWLAVKDTNAHRAAKKIKGSFEAQLRRIFY